jgi:hypothetical protein
MNEQRRSGTDLVMTEADLPPGVDAPPPPETNEASAGPSRGRSTRPVRDVRSDRDGLSVELLHEVRQLADRVGGLDKLREIVDELARIPR